MQQDYCPVAMTLEHPEMLTGDRDGQMLKMIKLASVTLMLLNTTRGLL